MDEECTSETSAILRSSTKCKKRNVKINISNKHLKLPLKDVGNRDSSVGIATGYGLDG
jgi:hypothetical protein